MRRYAYPIGHLSNTYGFSYLPTPILAVLAPLSVYVLRYPTSRFRASSSLKKTAHLRSLRHVIMSLGPLFWVAFSVSGLSRLRGATSPSAVARTSTSIFLEWLYNNPEKSRKTPTQVEVDRVEQSLTRIRADLEIKKEEFTSLKRRDTSQTEVVYPVSDCYASPDLGF